MSISPTASHSDINAVLQQMRAIRAQTQAGAQLRPQALQDDNATTVAGNKRAEFGNALKHAIDTVNELQQTASKSQTAFVRGEETNLVKVMVDSQKSSVGFQAMVQVRNRMVTAYQDIMKMPI